MTSAAARVKSPDIVGPFVHGLWQGVTASPWTIAFSILLMLGFALRVFRFFRWLPLTAATRDPMRRFARADRAAIIRRAGGRCEFHGLIGGRCRATENLHADHVHPHSRGGSTTLGNGQALCARHNRQKAAHIPYEWQIRKIEKQRRTYFPTGENGAVLRHYSPARNSSQDSLR